MKISIITATYNSGKTLKDTIQSVLSQSYHDIEYIIKDGGSSDNTLQIIKEFEPLFNGRLKWVSGKDAGLYDAINTGIKMASGDIVGIINSDDFFHRNDIIQIVASSFNDKSVEAIFGDMRYVNPENLNRTIRYYSSKHFKPFKFRYGFMPGHPTFYTYKGYFEKFGYYKLGYKIAADYELLIRFLYVNKLNYKYIPEDFLKMRTGGVSTSGFESTIILNKEIVRACKENGIYTNMPMLFFKYFVKIFEFINTKNNLL